MGVYTFVTEDTAPRPIGGSWIAGQIVNDLYEPRKDGAGNELPADKQPIYIGGQKSIKFVVAHNVTGLEYRLNATAFESAFKAVGELMSFAALEMSQSSDDSSNYAKAMVTLG